MTIVDRDLEVSYLCHVNGVWCECYPWGELLRISWDPNPPMLVLETFRQYQRFNTNSWNSRAMGKAGLVGEPLRPSHLAELLYERSRRSVETTASTTLLCILLVCKYSSSARRGCVRTTARSVHGRHEAKRGRLRTTNRRDIRLRTSRRRRTDHVDCGGHRRRRRRQLT